MEKAIEITHPKETTVTLKIKNTKKTFEAIEQKFGKYNKDWKGYGFPHGLEHMDSIQLSNGKVILIKYKLKRNYHVKITLNHLKNLILHKESHSI